MHRPPQRVGEKALHMVNLRERAVSLAGRSFPLSLHYRYFTWYFLSLHLFRSMAAKRLVILSCFSHADHVLLPKRQQLSHIAAVFLCTQRDFRCSSCCYSLLLSLSLFCTERMFFLLTGEYWCLALFSLAGETEEGIGVGV